MWLQSWISRCWAIWGFEKNNWSQLTIFLPKIYKRLELYIYLWKV